MPTLTSLTVNLKGDSSSLVKATTRGMKAIGALSKGIGTTVLKVGGLAGAITGLAGAGGLLALGRASATSVDAIGKLSTQLQISGTDVQKLGLVAELSGLKSETLVKAMQRTTRVLGDASRGSKEARKVFADLGLQWDTLEKVSPVERFKTVTAALANMDNDTQKASIAARLFEEQWQRMNPLLRDFESNWQRAEVVFNDMGFGIGGLSGGVEELNDDFSVMSTMLVAFRDLVFAKAAPPLQTITNYLGSQAEQWIKAQGGAAALADALLSHVGPAVVKALGWLENLQNAITGIIWSFETLVGTVKAVGVGGAAGAAIVDALLEGNTAGAKAIYRDLPYDMIAAFTGEEQKPVTPELEKQTQLLREVVKNGATGALVF